MGETGILSREVYENCDGEEEAVFYEDVDLLQKHGIVSKSFHCALQPLSSSACIKCRTKSLSRSLYVHQEDKATIICFRCLRVNNML